MSAPKDTLRLPRAQRIAAPCKVNLTLDVGSRRPDGFHDLDSVVAIFSPADVLTVSVAPGDPRIELVCGDPTLPTDAANLAHRAATAFLERFAPGENLVVRIQLDKRIPVQAGLGGGSSDAAATLRALAKLLPGRASENDLRALAATIGSDVPLFLAPDSGVRMSGRGETVAPLPASLPPLHGVLVKPEAGVPTGPAYALLDALPARVPGNATPRLLDVLASSPNPDAFVATLASLLHNDFEAAILPAYPTVAHAHRAVTEAGALRTLLCGSGAAVFGLARDAQHAHCLVDALRGQFPWVVQAATEPATDA